MFNYTFRRRQHDPEDMAVVIAILRNNDEMLNRIARAGFMSREQVIALAIQHFGSLPLKEQWKLAKQRF